MATIDNLDIQIAGSAKKANVAINVLIKNLDRLANSLKIDTSGLEKIGKSFSFSNIDKAAKNIQSQTQKVSKSLSQITEQYKDLGKGFEIKGSTQQIQKQIDTLTNKLANAKLAKDDFEASGKTNLGGYETAVKNVIKYTNQIESLKKQLAGLQTAHPKFDFSITGAENSEKFLIEYKKELMDFKNDMKSIGDVYGGLQNVPKGFLDTPIQNLKQSIEELKQSYPQAINVISGFEKELQKLEGVAAGLTKKPVAVKVDTSSLDKAKDDVFDKIKSLQSKFEDSGLDFVFEGNSEQLEKEIQKVNQEIDNLFNKQDRMIDLGKVDTDSFKGVIRDIENATNRLKILEDARPEALNRTLQENAEKARKSSEEMEILRGKLNQLVIPPINETNLEKLQSELKKTEEELERLREKLANGLIMGDIKESPDDRGFQNFSAEITLAEKKADALRQKIQDIGGAAKAAAALKELPKLFQNLGKTAKKAATIIKSVASKITSAFSKIGNSSKQLKTASLNLGSLLKTAIGFKAIRELGEFGKEAIGLGSNIAEVENIVNAAFGSMAGMAYDFASTATEKFGLSELAAKKYSGTMMAMLKSSGVAQGAAAQMSTTLAGLAGDLASFYNIDADTAFQKLRAGISGETEPLKQLGINMNIVNLEAFAAAQGINKAYREMTLAEQATLRYNYILAKTGDAQGDFARTSGTWANQIRLLKMNFESLSAIIGQGLIAAILPAIQMLNKLMSVLKKAAESFRTFMYTLMGKKVEGSQGGIADSMDGMEDISYGMADVEDATDGTTDSVKELKKALSVLSFDELHQLSAAMEDLGKDTGKTDTGNLDDLGNVLGGAENLWDELAKTDVEGPISEWAKRIREAFLAQDWERLGYEIADGINRGLQKIYDAINWKNVGPKIEKFMDAFTRTFNSLVDNIDWDLLGRTLGAGINTLVNTLNLLIEGIDFKNIGRKLSEGLRGMVGEIEWRSLGNLFGNYFMISWDILNGFVTDMARKNDAGLTGFAELGVSIGEAVNGVFEKIDFSEIYQTVTTGINGIFESIKNLADTINWDEIAANISNGLNTMIHGMDWEGNGQALNEFMSKFLGAVLRVAENTDWEGLGRGIGEFLSQIDWGKHLGTVAKIIVEVLGGLLSGLSETTAGKWVAGLGAALLTVNISAHLLPFVDSIVKFFTGESVGIKITKALAKMIGKPMTGAAVSADGLSTAFGKLTVSTGALSTALTAISAIGVGYIFTETFIQTLDEIGEMFGLNIQEIRIIQDEYKGWTGKIKGIIEPFRMLGRAMEGLPFSGTTTSWDALEKAIAKTSKGYIYSDKQMKKMQKTWSLSREDMESLRQSMLDANEPLRNLADSFGLFDASAETLQDIEQGMNLLKDGTVKTSEAFKEFSKPMWGMTEEAKNFFAQISDGTLELDDFQKQILESSEYAEIFGRNIEKSGKYVGEGFVEGMKKVDLSSAINDFFNKFDTNVRQKFGIHSPAEKTKPLGTNILLGIAEGFSESIPEFSSRIQEWFDSSVSPWFTSERWSQLWGNIKESATEKWNELVDWWNNSTLSKWWSESVSPWFTLERWFELWENVKTSFLTKWEEIVNWWETSALGTWWNNNVMPWFTAEKWSELFNNIYISLQNVWNGLEEWWNSSAVSKWFENSVKPWFTEEKWSDVFATIKKSLDNTWNELINWWNNSTLSIWWSESVSPWFTKEKWTQLYDSIKNSLKETWNKAYEQWKLDISDWWNKHVSPWFTKEKWEGLMSKIPEIFSSKFGEAKEKVIGKMKEMYDGIVGWVQNAIEKVQNLIEKIKEAASTKSSSSSSSSSSRLGSSSKKYGVIIPKINIPKIEIPKINIGLRKFAKGGLVNGLTPAIIGEAGREAVLPLQNRKTMSMISESILSNVSGIGMDEDTLVDAVARGVAMALMNNQQNPVNVTCYAELKTEDNEVLARAVTKGQQKLDYRMNPTPQYG